mmetsp:Transcript_115829/g.236799  ORF Transcript_115829/g.236799 Transcript_115829/m.236799 type:complete len:92 (+) Transcript_115829:1423-1698(+)
MPREFVDLSIPLAVRLECFPNEEDAYCHQTIAAVACCRVGSSKTKHLVPGIAAGFLPIRCIVETGAKANHFVHAIPRSANRDGLAFCCVSR